MKAFTLPEVLVAVLIFAVGILGLASSGTFIAVQAGEARAITEGTVLASRVLDSLRAMPCASVSGGQATLRAATVRWSTSPAARTLSIVATLDIPTRGATQRQWTFSTLVPC